MVLKGQPITPLTTEDKVNLVYRMITDLETKLDQHLKNHNDKKV